MSGSTIGGVLGGVIGFVASGYQPAGFQWGFAIGSMVGGYVDPDVIKAPSIGDAAKQGSTAGWPIPKVYGHPAPQGVCLIDGDPIARKITVEEEQGKGAPTVVTSERFIATRCFLVCEGEIAGYARIRRNGKLVYSTIAGDQLDADSAAFRSQLRLYYGTETQLPDAALEAIHGVGEAHAYRGKAYFIVVDDDEGQQGVPNQYQVEPVGSGTVTSGSVTPTFGVQTHTYTLPSDTSAIYDFYRPNYCKGTDDGLYVAYADPESTVGAGADAYVQKQLDNTLTEVSGKSITQDGGGRSGYYAFAAAEKDSQWSISSNNCPQLFRNGTYCCDLTIGGDNLWWTGEGAYTPEFGGLIWFDIPTGLFGASGTVYIGARRSGSPVATRNRLYAWDLTTTPGSYDPVATSSLICPTATDTFWMHMDRLGSLWTISTDGHLKQWDGSLTLQTDYTLSAGLAATVAAATFDAFGVDGNYLFCFSRTGTSLTVYELATWTLVQTIALTGSFDTYNCQVQFNNDSIFVRSGRYIKRIAYHASCVVGLPTGWYELPDTPNYVSSPSGDLVPICGTEGNRLSPDAAILKDIVLDIAGRVPAFPIDRMDVDSMLDEVPGYRLTRSDLSAIDYMIDVSTPYWWDFADYDDQIHGIARGGAIVETITDDDLLEIEADDVEIRNQQIEYPGRVTFFYPDPANNYVMTPQPAGRESPDVLASSVINLQTQIPFTSTQAIQRADIFQKIAFARAEGKITRALPSYFTRLVPTDAIAYNERRYMIKKTSRDDSMITIEAEYDRITAYASTMTGESGPAPQAQASNLKGPTRFIAMNLPQLRTADNVPGMYVAACGILPGWPGCDLQVSVDGGASYQTVLRMTKAAVMGVMQDTCDADGADSTGLIKVKVTGTLNSITADQVAARQNAFAIIDSDGLAEVGQFQDAAENTDGGYDLTNVIRGELETVATTHYAGEAFCLLDAAVYFLPLDTAYAGQAIRFRPVTVGTVADSAPTFDVVFDMPIYFHDGGEVIP